MRRQEERCCACPARPVRAQTPAVFRRYYKTAGIAPFKPTQLFPPFLLELPPATPKLVSLIRKNRVLEKRQILLKFRALKMQI